MALRAAPSAGFLRSFLAVAQARFGSNVAQSRSILQTPLLGTWQPALLPAITIPIPSLVSDLWESVLRAVPKKKTSHMKKRHRQMAGKALKDVTALNTCSSCGRTKRAHVLCPHCVASKLRPQIVSTFSQKLTLFPGIKRWFGNDFSPKNQKKAESKESTDAPSKSEGGEQ